MMNGVLSWRYYTLLCLISVLAIAQEAPSPSPPPAQGPAAPVRGQYRPAPQENPTRVVALVPVVGLAEAPGAKAPLFLEDFHRPESAGVMRTRIDSSKAEVPAGITSFRAMYSDDNQWALVDLKALNAAALEPVRKSGDTRVRIFTAEDLGNLSAIRGVSLPQGLSLQQFLEE